MHVRTRHINQKVFTCKELTPYHQCTATQTLSPNTLKADIASQERSSSSLYSNNAASHSDDIMKEKASNSVVGSNYVCDTPGIPAAL